MVNQIFDAGLNFLGAARLMTQARVSFISPLPISMVPKPRHSGRDARRRSPGVRRHWQKTQLFMFSVDPQRHHDAYPELAMPEDQWKVLRTRAPASPASSLPKYGWKIGQKIPFRRTSSAERQQGLTFDLVGIYDGKDED
jgi:putative ABC transport system permease protein